MGTKKISELTSGTLSEGDIVVGNEGGVTKGLTAGVDVVNDTTPVLGGNLSAGGFTIDGRTVATDGTKLDGIEALADVTDATNVTAAGALMDSELTSIADVKALDQSVVSGASPVFAATNMTDGTDKNFISDAEAVVLGNTSGTNSGDEATASVTVSGISESATVAETDTGTDAVRHVTPASLAGSALQTKVDGIEALADVTDTTNVTAAGALMDSEVDADIKTLILPANTTISAFGATLVDDAAASNARTTLGVAIGTDVQAYDVDLTELATAYTSESATTAATLDFLEGTNNGSNKVTLAGPASTADVTVTLPAATDTLIGKATTDTLTNKTFDANGTGNSLSNVDIADLANGTDGELITWDAAGAPAAVAVGTATHVLTSNGAGTAPTFQAFGGLQRFKAYVGSAQSISNSTLTKVQLDTESFDSESEFDSTTNYRHTPTEAGKWVYVAQLAMSGMATDDTLQIIIRKNNVTALGVHKYIAFGTDAQYCQTICSTDMDGSTDYVELQVTQDSGGSLNLTAGEGFTYMFAYRID